MPTRSQDKEFAEEMKDSVDFVQMSNGALDNAINWIDNNLDPEQVFSSSKLETWAENNGYTKQ